MKVTVYHRSVPNAKNQEKIDLLRKFAQGVQCTGDQLINVDNHDYCTADVAVIQGWINEFDSVNMRAHLNLRKTVIEQQLKNNSHVIAVDSNLFLYANTDNPLHYLRYSFDGIFPNTGIYCDKSVNPERWKKISQDLNIKLQPYRNNGRHILLLLQRNGGWSMQGYHVLDWIAQTILTLRKYTDRPIIIRAHPGDKSARDYIGEFSNTGELKNVSLSFPGSSLLQDLSNCWAAVNHNSSPVVGAAIEGYPIFVTDPARSQCAEIANTDLSQIEHPQLPDRQQWVERLAMSHWNFDELKSGECWRHMRKYIV
jgi:hypothetical protein